MNHITNKQQTNDANACSNQQKKTAPKGLGMI